MLKTELLSDSLFMTSYLPMEDCVTTIRGESKYIPIVLSDFKAVYIDLLNKSLLKLQSFAWQLRIELLETETNCTWEFKSRFYVVDSSESAVYAVEKASKDISSEVEDFQKQFEC